MWFRYKHASESHFIFRSLMLSENIWHKCQCWSITHHTLRTNCTDSVLARIAMQVRCHTAGPWPRTPTSQSVNWNGLNRLFVQTPFLRLTQQLRRKTGCQDEDVFIKTPIQSATGGKPSPSTSSYIKAGQRTITFFPFQQKANSYDAKQEDERWL